MENLRGGKMKKLVALMGIVALTGCGVKAEDNRDSLTKEQRAEIEERITSFSVVNMDGQSGIVQVAMVDLPGKAKYMACGACHGTQGQGGIGPMLAGQSVDYIVGRLKAYRNGEQVGAQSALMWGQASGLSDQDIQDLAEYVESL